MLWSASRPPRSQSESDQQYGIIEMLPTTCSLFLYLLQSLIEAVISAG